MAPPKSPLPAALAHLSDARAREFELRKRLVYLNRLLEQQGAEIARKEYHEKKQAAGRAAKVEKDKLFHRDVAASMANEPRATLDDVTEISLLLNEAQRKIVPAWQSASWFRLFKYVDTDGSGLIAYDEFAAMVRDILRLSTRALPEPRLKALWLALDTDCSGHLSSGEFGAFMRLGAPRQNRVSQAKLSALERKRAAGAATRLEKDKLFHRDLAASMINEPRASESEIAELSAVLNVAQRSVVPGWQTPSWFKLFRHVDADGSGLIAYDEFVDMVRNDLKMSTSSLPESSIKALWLALDTDCSGYLSSGEFGAFMRLGAPVAQRLNPLEQRRLLAVERRLDLEASTAEEVRFEALKVERDSVLLELKAIELARKVSRTASSRSEEWPLDPATGAGGGFGEEGDDSPWQYGIGGEEEGRSGYGLFGGSPRFPPVARPATSTILPRVLTPPPEGPVAPAPAAPRTPPTPSSPRRSARFLREQQSARSPSQQKKPKPQWRPAGYPRAAAPAHAPAPAPSHAFAYQPYGHNGETGGTQLAEARGVEQWLTGLEEVVDDYESRQQELSELKARFKELEAETALTSAELDATMLPHGAKTSV